mgnify:CR=1 FL=1
MLYKSKGTPVLLQTVRNQNLMLIESSEKNAVLNFGNVITQGTAVLCIQISLKINSEQQQALHISQ